MHFQKYVYDKVLVRRCHLQTQKGAKNNAEKTQNNIAQTYVFTVTKENLFTSYFTIITEGFYRINMLTLQGQWPTFGLP